MKYLSFIALLLLAVPVGAGEQNSGIHPNNLGKCWESTAVPDGQWSEARQVPCLDPDVPTPVKPCCLPDCLAQMEAAMKANDGHLAIAYLRAKGNPSGKAEYTEQGIDRFDHDYYQWNAAKQCWRTP